ncbi:hypothetical protein MTO96_040734 [Rhipicephalus appendiculatus]
MPVNCCVPLCTQFGGFEKSGKKVSYHRFPRDPDTHKQWITAITRDDGPLFKVSKATNVCYLHFLESDFVANVANGYRHLHNSAVSSVFPFKQLKPPRKPPAQRVPLQKVSSAKSKRKVSDQGLPTKQGATCTDSNRTDDKEKSGDATNRDSFNEGSDALDDEDTGPTQLPEKYICILEKELAASRASEAATQAEN